MQFVFLTILALLVFLHPYITYPLSLLLLPPRPIAPRAGAPLPSASLLFSARNEEKALPVKLANLREIKALHPDIQLLGYSDASTDGTVALMQACPGLEVISSDQRTGKAVGMARLVAAARNDICIFTDANVMVEPASIARLLAYFTDPAIGGVAGSLHYGNAEASPTAQVGALYWRWEEWIKRLETRCGSLMGADGSIFATRRLAYPDVPPHLLDDLTVSMSAVLDGRRLVIAPDVLAFENGATSERDEFARKRRIACRAYNTHRHLWPMIRRRFDRRDIYKYVSHKLLRWIGVVPLLVAGAFFLATVATAGGGVFLGLACGVAAVMWILGRLSVPPFAMGVQIIVSIAATFVGLVEAWRGKTYRTWEPAPSRD